MTYLMFNAVTGTYLAGITCVWIKADPSPWHGLCYPLVWSGWFLLPCFILWLPCWRLLFLVNRLCGMSVSDGITATFKFLLWKFLPLIIMHWKGLFGWLFSGLLSASWEQWHQSLSPIDEHLAPHSLCFISEFIVVKIYLTNWLTFHSMIVICCLIRWD